MSSKGILSINEVNAIATDSFEWLFGNVIEHCPEAALAVAAKRPFASANDLKKAFENYLDESNDLAKETILRKHPDLTGKSADGKKLTEDSQNEQKLAGLDDITKEERLILMNYNMQYKDKFKFPFIICARENKFSSILLGFETRMKNNKETELQNGINEVKKICRMRIDDLVWRDL